MNMQQIILKNISRSFGAHCVLNHINADFENERVHVILGPSGIGKTTLLRILMGLETADEGTVSGMEGLKKTAVFQEDRLIDTLSAGANAAVVMPKQMRKNKLLDMHADFEKAGLGGLFDQPAGTLSGGQKRRTAILRALWKDADVCFFDEALRELDDESIRRMQALILDHVRQKTVFWVTHTEDYTFFDHPIIWKLDEKGLQRISDS